MKAQLGDVGITKSKAEGAGDCYPLSVMAGFEIAATLVESPLVKDKIRKDCWVISYP